MNAWFPLPALLAPPGSFPSPHSMHGEGEEERRGEEKCPNLGHCRLLHEVILAPRVEHLELRVAALQKKGEG